MKSYAVIGNPISHSLSPKMHRANFESLKIDATYDPIHVDDVAQAIEKLKQLDGFNITVPHKESIVPFLNEVDPLAQKVGAVNTVKNIKGHLVGYNTDVEGFYECFSKHEISKHASILIIGAGGASKAVYYGLRYYGYDHIVIANRTLERAQKITANAITLQVAEATLDQYDVIINSTSVGLIMGECPIQLNKLMSKTLVMDLIYKPKETTLLALAKEKGCRTENGLEMLLNQGALAFEIWQEQSANKTVMKQQLEEALYAIR